MKTRTRVATTSLAASLTALSLLGVSGCGLSSPGTASTVGDETISVARVQDVTAAFCDLIRTGVASGQAQPVALAQQKQQLLGVMIETALNTQFAADEDVTAPAEVSGYLASQLTQGFDQLDAADKEVLTDLVDELAEGRAALAAVAAKQSGTQLSPDNLDQLQQAGLQLRQTWQRGIDVETDARYAPGADGTPGGGDLSVSTATSAFAKQASAAAQGQDPGYAASLPASQRCGG